MYELSDYFLPKEWIMEQWEEGFYITSMAGSNHGSSLVVMSKGTPYTQQSYKVSDSFPFKWISKKWKEGFHVTSMATSKTRWAVVMSRNAGFVEQCVELDFQYPSEGIHRRWDAGIPPSQFTHVPYCNIQVGVRLSMLLNPQRSLNNDGHNIFTSFRSWIKTHLREKACSKD